MEEIASSEGRSTAQICEAFLKAGTDNYRKKGSKFIKGFIAQQKKEHPGVKHGAVPSEPVKGANSRPQKLVSDCKKATP